MFDSVDALSDCLHFFLFPFVVEVLSKTKRSSRFSVNHHMYDSEAPVALKIYIYLSIDIYLYTYIVLLLDLQMQSARIKPINV